jgi:hypothetical protein
MGLLGSLFLWVSWVQFQCLSVGPLPTKGMPLGRAETMICTEWDENHRLGLRPRPGARRSQ